MNKIFTTAIAMTIATLSATAMAACPTGTTLAGGKCVSTLKSTVQNDVKKTEHAAHKMNVDLKKDVAQTDGKAKKTEEKIHHSMNTAKVDLKKVDEKAKHELEHKPKS